MTINSVKTIWGFRFDLSSLDKRKELIKELDNGEDINYDYIEQPVVYIGDELKKYVDEISNKCVINYIRCSHKYIYFDIGFPTGEFDLKERYPEKKRMSAVRRTNQHKMSEYIKFTEEFKERFENLPIWKYRVRDEPSLYCLANDCHSCS